MEGDVGVVAIGDDGTMRIHAALINNSEASTVNVTILNADIFLFMYIFSASEMIKVDFIY